MPERAELPADDLALIDAFLDTLGTERGATIFWLRLMHCAGIEVIFARHPPNR